MSSISRFTSYVSRFTFHVSRFTSHFPLLLILLIFTLLTLYQSIILPIGEAADETDHYQYLRFVARTGHPPLTETERNEAGFKGGLAPLYYWLTAWPVALVGEQALPDIRRVDTRPERYIPTDGLGINHVLHTLDEQWPWRGQILTWHLVRLLSLPMGWVTLVATYALARRLLPEAKIVAIGAVTLAAFLPRFVISSAVINDDNLVFALTALLLLVQVIILQRARPASLKLFALFGALLGLTLVTKYFSLILIPEVLLTLFLAHRAQSKEAESQQQIAINTHHVSRFTFHASRFTLHVSRFTPTLVFLLTLALTAGPWFTFIIVRFNRINELGFIPGLAASLGEPQITEGLVGLLSGQSVRPVAATYSLPAWFSLLYRSFWFEYGWMQLFAPGWVYALFTLFLLLALFGLLIKRPATGDRRLIPINHQPLPANPTPPSPLPTSDTPHVSRFTFHISHFTFHVSRFTFHVSRFTFHVPPITCLLALHLALFGVVLIARYILSATIDTGQGRHLYPALPVIAFLLSLGLINFGFWIVKAFHLSATDPHLSTSHLPSPTSHLPSPTSYLPSSILSLLSSLFYLLPAAFCLFSPTIVLSHYRPLPVTTTPPAALPITHQHTLPFAEGLYLAGFEVTGRVSAGQALPVTLYWRAEQEAEQDYLVSVCVQDELERPAACWRGHFANGHYPARAWEAGDTLIDTIFIPIPTCYRLKDQPYHLQLELWPLALDSARPEPGQSPILQQTFREPLISIQPTDSLLTNLPQTVELWRAAERVTDPVVTTLNETLTQLTYAGSSAGRSTPVRLEPESELALPWLPLQPEETALFLPCDDGPTPFAYLAHFIADPTLTPGLYHANPSQALPEINLSLRSRTFAPITSTLTFAATLAPLSWQPPHHAPLPLVLENGEESRLAEPDYLPILPSAPLPLTIHWQARRWMADPLIVSLKLLDKDFMIGGERVATLGDRYPNVLWAPGEIIAETYPLQLRPDAPPGLYRLEMSLLRQDKELPDGYEYLPLLHGDTPAGNNLYPATFRLLDPAYGAPPPHPFSAQLGDTIHLTGYDLNPPSPIPHLPSTIRLALYWQSTAKIPADYTVFTQLLGPDGQVWAQWDNPPQAGRYPTGAWAAQDEVIDRYTLTLPEEAPTGPYRLLVGMYDPTTNQRLPATIKGEPQPNNAIELTTLSFSNEP